MGLRTMKPTNMRCNTQYASSYNRHPSVSIRKQNKDQYVDHNVATPQIPRGACTIAGKRSHPFHLPGSRLKPWCIVCEMLNDSWHVILSYFFRNLAVLLFYILFVSISHDTFWKECMRVGHCTCYFPCWMFFCDSDRISWRYCNLFHMYIRLYVWIFG